MRKFILSIMALVLLVAGPAWAADVTLTWDANTESDMAGYRLYQKADSAVPPFIKVQDIPKGTTVANITGLDSAHSHSFAVTAYNTAGMESPYSNIVTVPAAPLAPAGLKWSLTLTVTGGQ